MKNRENSRQKQEKVFFFGKKKQKTFVSLVLWFTTAAAHAAPPPASAYAEQPSAASARMSPDGKSVAFIDGQGDALTVTVSQIDGDKVLPMPSGDWTPKW